MSLKLTIAFTLAVAAIATLAWVIQPILPYLLDFARLWENL